MTTKKQFTTVDEYIKTFPKNTQSILQNVRQTIQKVAPDATEAISYQIPTFKLNGRYVVYFSGWKSHIALYPIPPGTDAFKKEIAPYVKGKGTIQFPLDKPIPYGLVSKAAKFHLKNVAQENNIVKSATKSKSKPQVKREARPVK